MDNYFNKLDHNSGLHVSGLGLGSYKGTVDFTDSLSVF